MSGSMSETLSNLAHGEGPASTSSRDSTKAGSCVTLLQNRESETHDAKRGMSESHTHTQKKKTEKGEQRNGTKEVSRHEESDTNLAIMEELEREGGNREEVTKTGLDDDEECC